MKASVLPDLFCRNCFKDLEFRFDMEENRAVLLRDLDFENRGTYCQKCYPDALERLKKHRLVEFYNGKPIYQKNKIFTPYWGDVRTFGTLEDCKEKMSSKHQDFEPTKIYRVHRDDFKDLMIKLEAKGYRWASGKQPTDAASWTFREDVVFIKVEDGVIKHGELAFYKVYYASTPITDYKRK